MTIKERQLEIIGFAGETIIINSVERPWFPLKGMCSALNEKALSVPSYKKYRQSAVGRAPRSYMKWNEAADRCLRLMYKFKPTKQDRYYFNYYRRMSYFMPPTPWYVEQRLMILAMMHALVEANETLS